MYKYLLLALSLVITGCKADTYVPVSHYEMARAVDDMGNVYQLHSSKMIRSFVEDFPYCADRKLMTFTDVNVEMESMGCWWNIGEQVYTWDSLNGTKKIPMDRLVTNDKFTGELATGF